MTNEERFLLAEAVEVVNSFNRALIRAEYLINQLEKLPQDDKTEQLINRLKFIDDINCIM